MVEIITCAHIKRNKGICGKTLTGINTQRGYCAGCWRTVQNRSNKNKNDGSEINSDVPQCPIDITPPNLDVPSSVKLNTTDIYPYNEEDSDTEILEIKQTAPVKQVIKNLNSQTNEPPPLNNFISEDDFTSITDTENEVSPEEHDIIDEKSKNKTSTLHVINDGITLTFNVISSLPNMQGFGAKVQQMAPDSLKHLVIEMCHEENYCDVLDDIPASKKLLLLLGGAMVATYLENTKSQINNLPVPTTEDNKPPILSQLNPYNLLAKPNENNKSESMINMNLI